MGKDNVVPDNTDSLPSLKRATRPQYRSRVNTVPDEAPFCPCAHQTGDVEGRPPPLAAHLPPLCRPLTGDTFCPLGCSGNDGAWL
ncbi:hypothetical protein ACOMHN_035810 [Nucella lapillus]